MQLLQEVLVPKQHNMSIRVTYEQNGFFER